MADDAFLQSLLDDPRDDNLRLIYADWLDEQGDAVSSAKAEFLRLTVVLASNQERRGKRKSYRKRLQKLAAALDSNWLAVVSRLPIENCLGQGGAGRARRIQGLRQVLFDFVCDRRWEDLQATDNRNVRHCGACKLDVHYCGTIHEARKHAVSGHCIAVDLGVIRHDGDLATRTTEGLLGKVRRMGRVRSRYLEGAREPRQSDSVSPERERRKKKMRRGPSLDENE